jgi:hypothetical protein
MGPAAIDGQDAVSALQATVDTENGEHFVDRQGFIQFKSRSARYNATVPMYTFGENVTAGEWPYEDVTLDYDSTHLSNQVTVTQESSGQNFYATDATSITSFFPRTMTRTINASSTAECQDAANYLLSRYKNPAQRVSSIKLHPSAYPAMWPVMPGPGTRHPRARDAPGTRRPGHPGGLLPGEPLLGVRRRRRRLADPAMLAGRPDAVWGFRCLAHQARHLPLGRRHIDHRERVSGQHQHPGQSAWPRPVAGPRTEHRQSGDRHRPQRSARHRQAGRLRSITLTAATTKAHTAGDWVNEPLPAGTTDPTTYDAVSQFDSVAFTY